MDRHPDLLGLYTAAGCNVPRSHEILVSRASVDRYSTAATERLSLWGTTTEPLLGPYLSFAVEEAFVASYRHAVLPDAEKIVRPLQGGLCKECYRIPIIKTLLPSWHM